MTDRIVDGRIQAIQSPNKWRSAKRIDGEKDVVILESPRGGVEQRSFLFPLDFYLRMELIERRQWLAGDRLNELYAEGTLPGYVQFKYRDGGGGGKQMNPDPSGVMTREYRAAMMAIRGVPERRIAYEVCCEGKSLTLLWRLNHFTSKRTAQRVGMPRLRDALNDLADHFRY